MEIYPSRKMARRLAATAAVCALCSIPALSRGGGALLTIPVIWLIGGIYFYLFQRTYQRRRRIAANTIDDLSRKILEQRVSFYRGLDPARRRRYERQLLVFLSEHRIVGIEGVEVTREAEVLVAASAIRLTFGRSDWEYPDFGEIILYPGKFRADRSFSIELEQDEPGAAGLVHSGGGVILSLPHLLRGFEDPEDGYNVGYHEFAHLLDGFPHPDGVPANLDLGAYRAWVMVMQGEFEKTRQGRSALRAYAGKSPAEFFACAVEAFFEAPRELESNSPELFDLLAEYFNQDPRETGC